MEFDGQRPYPNEHICELESASNMDHCFRKHVKDNNNIGDYKHTSKPYDLLICYDKKGKSHTVSYHYKKDGWTPEQGRKHCKAHGGSFIEATGEKKMDRIKENGLFYRDIEIDERAIDTKGRKIDLSFSSEIVVQRWFGQEILSHKEDAIIKGRLHTMLFGHDSKAIVGPVKNIQYDDGKGRATAHFDETNEGELALTRVKSGSLRGVSVGYAVAKFKKLAAGEEYELATKKVKGPKDEESNPIYIAEKWAPIEISLTPIPADHTVGVGREATRSLEGIEIEEPVIEKENINPDSKEVRQIKEKGGIEEMDEKELQAKIDEALKGRDSAFQERMKKVFNRAATVGMEGLAFRILSEGKTDEEITDAILSEMKKQRGVPTDGGEAQKVQVALDKIDDDTLARALTNPVMIEL